MKLYEYFAKVKYKSGTYEVRVQSTEDNLEVKDCVVVRVPSGYETTAIITDVLNRSVNSAKLHRCFVISKKDEEVKHMEQIVKGKIIVKIKHDCSNRTVYCYTDIPYPMCETVVYESDNGLHVGEITDGCSVDNIAEWDNFSLKAGCVQYWVVDRVDMSGYNNRAQMVKDLTRVRNQLEVKRQQYQELELLNLIAKNDPETAALLDTYKSLLNSGVTFGSDIRM